MGGARAPSRGSGGCGAYSVAAFAVVQAVELWLPGLGATDLAVRAVLGVAVLGFPVAIVVTWTYDVFA
jgi:hypothetical protein